MILNCGVEEDSWESLGLLGDPTSPSERRSVLIIHWKDWCWSWNSNIWPSDAKNWLIWKDPDAGKDCRWEKGTTGGEMVGWHHRLNGHEFQQAPGKPGVLQSMGLQRVEQDWATELNWSFIDKLFTVEFQLETYSSSAQKPLVTLHCLVNQVQTHRI